MNIRVQGVMQLRSGRRDQDPAKDHPPTPHVIASVARGPEVSRVHSPNSAAGESRWRRTWAQKVHCNSSAASASDTSRVNADTVPGASSVRAPTTPVVTLPRGNSLSPVAAGVNTPPTTGIVLSAKRRRHPNRAERAPPQATQPP